VDAYLIDAVRTPFGRRRGGLAEIRTDDLAALPPAGPPPSIPAVTVAAAGVGVGQGTAMVVRVD
jgi:acetyl-CoA acetyltransferase